MRNAKLDRSIVLPPARIGPHHHPDGLTEPDIDALIAEVADEVRQSRRRPGWLSADEIDTRRSRRVTRQSFRVLATRLIGAHQTDQDEVA